MLQGYIQRRAEHRLRLMRERAAKPLPDQKRILMRLLGSASGTAFGREHGFGKFNSIKDYQMSVPLRSYAEFDAYWRRARLGERDVCWPGFIKYWALSSGTTSGEKYIPISRETIHNNQGGGFDTLAPAICLRKLNPVGGELLFLGGATSMRREGRVWVGDNTGIMARHIPFLLRFKHAPGREIAAITDWEEKIQRASEATVGADIRMIGGVPSWLILFAERALRVAGRLGLRAANLGELWPRLGVCIHGGVAFEPYRRRFHELYGSQLLCTDTYSASEGGMLAVQDRAVERDMLPIVDRGVFYEFIPVQNVGSPNPERLLLHEVEAGAEYAVAITSDSGIWSYLVGDIVRFTEGSPKRLVFAGRTAQTLNAFGEHLSASEIERAVTVAARDLHLRVGEFAVAPRFPEAGSPRGHHIYYIETSIRDTSNSARVLTRLAEAIDQSLSVHNEDYSTHRARGFGLDAPVVEAVENGVFYNWMRHRGKLGGQNKVPRMLTVENEISFRSFAGFRAPAGQVRGVSIR